MWKGSLTPRAQSANTLPQQGQPLVQNVALTLSWHINNSLLNVSEDIPPFCPHPDLTPLASPIFPFLEKHSVGSARKNCCFSRCQPKWLLWTNSSQRGKTDEAMGRPPKTFKMKVQTSLLGHTQKHLSTSVPWAASAVLWNLLWGHLSFLDSTILQTHLYLADIIFQGNFTLIKGEYLTWETGVETLSSTFLAAVTHLTLHQPSSFSGRARLLPHGISATATDHFPSWLLPSYKEANRNTTSLSLQLKAKNSMWGGFQPGGSKIRKVNSPFQRQLKLPRSSQMFTQLWN